MPNINEIIRSGDFDAIGVAPAELLVDEQTRLSKWLDQGMHGSMNYMERSVEIRHDPKALMPQVQSVIVTLSAYHRVTPHYPTIAAFAHCFKEYHPLIKNKLHALLGNIRQCDPTIRGRVVVDSAPTFERAWAVRAGLGWIGRSSMLINPTLGSYTIIGLLLIDKKVDWTTQIIKNGCPKSCNLCRNACPNGAINDNMTIDARRCISYLTIETDNPHYPTHDNIFGCDRCIDICPYNRQNSAIEPTINFDWQGATEEQFQTQFNGSSIQRSTLSRIKAIMESHKGCK